MNRLLKILGPGLLYAGAAIGVSHVYWSSSAGAQYGFALLWAVVLAHVAKYPFFQFGPRYAVATGRNLIEGYRRLGMWAFVLFVAFTITTMFTIQAAVTVVTAGLAQNLFGIALEAWQWSAILLIVCAVFLLSGKYTVLDRGIKYIILVLTVTLIVSVIAGVARGYDPQTTVEFPWTEVGIAFLIPLMGWLPAPLDLSVWSSIWTLEKQKVLGRRLTIKQSLTDFNIGYWGTMVMGMLFLTLGALVIFGTGTEIPKGAGAYANHFIGMFTTSIGEWGYWFIAIAAFATMFSTTITCFDALPRVMQSATNEARAAGGREKPKLKTYWFWMLVLGVGVVVILGFFITNMKQMVVIATAASFLIAPVHGLINYLVITGKDVPKEHRPNTFHKVLSLFGLLFLTGFGIVYVVVLANPN